MKRSGNSAIKPVNKQFVGTQFIGWGLVVPIALAIGCGKGAYDRLLTERLAILQSGTAFIEYLYPSETAIMDRVAWIRLPMLFDETATALAINSQDQRGVAIDPIRIQPPMAPIPGFQYSYERFIDVRPREGEPIYMYFGVVDKESMKEADLKNQVAAALRASWQDAPIPTPDGSTVTWQRVLVAGQQEFDLRPQGGELKPIKGRYELYLNTQLSPSHYLLVGLRAPDSLPDASKFFEHGKLSLGTVRTQQ